VQRTGVENYASCGSSQIIILDVTYIDGSNHFFFPDLDADIGVALTT